MILSLNCNVFGYLNDFVLGVFEYSVCFVHVNQIQQ